MCTFNFKTIPLRSIVWSFNPRWDSNLTPSLGNCHDRCKIHSHQPQIGTSNWAWDETHAHDIIKCTKAQWMAREKRTIKHERSYYINQMSFLIQMNTIGALSFPLRSAWDYCSNQTEDNNKRSAHFLSWTTLSRLKEAQARLGWVTLGQESWLHFPHSHKACGIFSPKKKKKNPWSFLGAEQFEMFFYMFIKLWCNMLFFSHFLFPQVGVAFVFLHY